MIVTVEIDEQTWKTLMDRAVTKDPKGISAAAAKVLGRFADVPQSDRVIILRAPERRQLEEVVGTTLDSPAHLVDFVRRLSAVKIGEVAYPLTVGQTIALTEQARFHGWPVQEYIKLTTDKVMEELLGKL